LVLLAVFDVFEALPPTGAAMVLAVALVLLVLLLVVSWLAEASSEAFADFDEVASREESLDFEAVAESDPCDALLSVAEADRDLSDDLLADAVAESDACDALLSVAEVDREASVDLLEVALVLRVADLLEVLSSDESWLELTSVDRLAVFSWLRVRLLSCVFDVSRDVSRVLLLDLLFVTSEEVESVA
jgi:hypothetical protein